MATTVTHTIKPSGGDYTSLSAWEAGEQGDLTGVRDEIARSVCYSMEDTTALTIDGSTTSATQYLTIEMDATGRHAGEWDEAKFHMNITDGTGIWFYDPYSRVDGIQIYIHDPMANYRSGILFQQGYCRASNCIVRFDSNTTYRYYGFNFGNPSAYGPAYAWNCVIYGISTANANSAAFNLEGSGGGSVYSCVGIGSDRPYIRSDGTWVLKNCYGGGAGSACYYGTMTMTACASSDHTGSAEALHAIAVNTDTFVNVTGGSEDFHLAADGASPLVGVGVDTSGEGAPLNFTTDIDGHTRDATWDIGADAWVVSGDTTLTVSEAGHGHAADNAVLTQAHTLAIADGLHAHSADAPALTQAHALTVADAAHDHAADAPALTQAHVLDVAEALLGHGVDAFALLQAHTLAVAEAAQGHGADNVTLVSGDTLVIDEAAHGHSAESPALTQAHVLAVQEAGQGHLADEPVLTQVHVLAVADAAHGHAAEEPTLDVSVILAVADSTHGHAVDAPALAQAHVLAVQGADHGHESEAPILSQAHLLTVDEAIQLLQSDNITLSGFMLEVADGAHGHAVDSLVLVPKVRNRKFIKWPKRPLLVARPFEQRVSSDEVTRIGRYK